MVWLRDLGDALLGLPVANAEFSTNIYIHTGHGPVDDLLVSTFNDHGRGF
jgi:hypothetical protein